MDKLTIGDYLYSWFMAPGGTTVWTIKRNGELCVQAIIGNQSRSLFHCEDFTGAAGIVSGVLQLLGFSEIPVFRVLDKTDIERNEMVRELLKQFNLYDVAVKTQKEQEAKKEAKKE